MNEDLEFIEDPNPSNLNNQQPLHTIGVDPDYKQVDILFKVP